MRRLRAGLTLIEVLVASLSLMVLVWAVFGVYVTGIKAWGRGNVDADLIQDLQVSLQAISSEAINSSPESVTVSTSTQAVSFLSARREDGSVDVVDGEIVWQRYLLFYLSGSELRRVDLPLAAGSSQRTVPGPIESYDPGGGPLSIDDYTTGGRVIGRDISDFEVQLDLDSQTLLIELEATKDGPSGPRRTQLSSAAHLRN